MSLQDTLYNAKLEVEKLSKNYRVGRMKKEHNNAVRLQTDLMNCRGKLERCKTDLKNEIRSIHFRIIEGNKIAQSTIALEGMLWDAALGYLLVEDAIFQVKNVKSVNTIYFAYDMLDQVVSHIDKKSKGSDISKTTKLTGIIKGYSARGNTNDVVKEKEAILEQIFIELKDTGDIEACLANERDNAMTADILRTVSGDIVRRSPASKADNDERQKRLSSMLNSINSSGQESEKHDEDINALKYRFLSSAAQTEDPSSDDNESSSDDNE